RHRCDTTNRDGRLCCSSKEVESCSSTDGRLCVAADSSSIMLGSVCRKHA
ncbi:hypothetical protein LSTR_LSTR009595, partial [Laodelphax striatellus]